MRVVELMAIVLGASAELVSAPDPGGEPSVNIRGSPRVRPASPSHLGDWELDIGDDAKDYAEANWPDEALSLTPTIGSITREDGRGWLQMTLPSRPFFIALAARLASWFGGMVEPDSDREEPPLESVRTCPTDSRGNIPLRGELLRKYRERLVSLRPLNDSEISSYEDRINRG